jgi:hypothetical protein
MIEVDLSDPMDQGRFYDFYIKNENFGKIPENNTDNEN